MNPDLINAAFEVLGAIVLLENVRAIRRDKRVLGMNPWVTVFFTSWGLWNLFYYPSLDQWASFSGGIALVLVNIVWLCHAWKYRRSE
jgi:hypothetical protein